MRAFDFGHLRDVIGMNTGPAESQLKQVFDSIEKSAADGWPERPATVTESRRRAGKAVAAVRSKLPADKNSNVDTSSMNKESMDKAIVGPRKTLVPILILMTMLVSYGAASARQKEMIVRISEIEIDANYLGEYKAILKEEAAASVRLEPGVISIFPMFQKGNPTRVRILEIYDGREAYESHLKTPHFQKYKTTTLRMVRSLKLVDMEAADAETMIEIFKKMKR